MWNFGLFLSQRNVNQIAGVQRVLLIPLIYVPAKKTTFINSAAYVLLKYNWKREQLISRKAFFLFSNWYKSDIDKKKVNMDTRWTQAVITITKSCKFVLRSCSSKKRLN